MRHSGPTEIISSRAGSVQTTRDKRDLAPRVRRVQDRIWRKQLGSLERLFARRRDASTVQLGTRA